MAPLHTRGLSIAEVTDDGCLPIRMQGDGPIGTGFLTCPAARAFLLMDFDNSEFEGLDQSAFRTGLHAFRSAAELTDHGTVQTDPFLFRDPNRRFLWVEDRLSLERASKLTGSTPRTFLQICYDFFHVSSSPILYRKPQGAQAMGHGANLNKLRDTRRVDKGSPPTFAFFILQFPSSILNFSMEPPILLPQERKN
jgi:hypothetical protein